MSHSYSDPPTRHESESEERDELKIYQAFIFSVPVVFTFILLFLFYLFYLRRRRVRWSALRMQESLQHNNDISRAELGLKKELRQMLPIIVYKESFSIKDTLCSVCLGDYQAEDRLQQIPACGHTFHMDCIDHWLTTHTTCPLCRLSLLASAKAPTEPPDVQAETSHRSSNVGNSGEIFLHGGLQACEDTQPNQQFSESIAREERNLAKEEESSSQCIDQEREFGNVKNGTEDCECSGEASRNCSLY
ncbi:hypothetical protein L1049_026591 [Liquidambar formosana]|uniref:RING-type E3 ubiquitin transferase n=1 Tax=Liquidambar formosana TaxID=63359 RepID=A0AAP0R842_LIQFO